MAECPTCQLVWQWDWNDDVFRNPDSGKECTTEEHESGLDPVAGKHTHTDYRCGCGQLLGTMCDADGMINDPSEWKDVDWEADENYYESYQPKEI